MRLTTGQRLTGLIALAILLVSAAGLVLQYQFAKRDLLARQENLVQADLAGFAALYDQRRIIAVRQAIEYRKLTDRSGDLLLVLRDRAGETLAGTVTAWPASAPVPPESSTPLPFRFTHDDTTYLGTARNLAGGFPLLVARTTTTLDQTLATLRQVIGWSMAAIALIALILGQFVSRWLLARIGRINALATRVAEGDLTARLPGPRAADEFGALEEHIHHMLDRIEALNRATHHLGDSVAHELRTPLTRIQTRLARLETDEPDKTALQDEIRATIRIFDSLLEIARAEAGTVEPRGPALLDLSTLLAEVCELYEPVAEARSIAFATDIVPGVTVLGDRNLIAQLISNLLENALKFTPEGESVRIALTPGDPHHIMEIADTGPGLPQGFETAIFDRFSRAASDPGKPGHGLGMALVKAVALRHGAKLSLPSVEKGFLIRIAWPKFAEKQ